MLLALLLVLQNPAGPPPQQAQDTNAAARQKAVEAVTASIAGKEQMPAESVFKNIKVFTGRPAQMIPRMMDGLMGRSLGVNCTHCHVEGDYASDDKPEKQIARDMMAMVAKINGELLPAIPNLKSTPARIGCQTCHRGQARPNMGGGGPPRPGN